MSKYGVFSGRNTGKYGPEKTPYLDTFQAVPSIITNGNIKEGINFIKIWKLMKLFTVYDRDLAVPKPATAKDLYLASSYRTVNQWIVCQHLASFLILIISTICAYFFGIEPFILYQKEL